MSLVIKGASLLGEQTTDLYVDDAGRLVDSAPDGAEVSTPTVSSRCPGSSTSTPTCASRDARTPRRSSPARRPRLSGATPPSWRWPTPLR